MEFLEAVGPYRLTWLEKLELKYPGHIGLYYMAASVSFMSLNALFVKLCEELPTFELLFLRAIFTFLLLYIYVSKFRPDLQVDDKKNRNLILALSGIGFVIATFYIYGIDTLQLSEAITVLFTTPMWLGGLSWMVFG
mmetsp:Transcript_20812/g.18201  ORF Transcript_20812/g.18201 Transcript_20812/m.18201 type:complete len:137 (+) Transcript_20812:168-578(+)